MNSVAPGTMKQYTSALRQWSKFCECNQEADFFNPTRRTLILFLQERQSEGLSFSALNTIRSAISFISEEQIGRDRMISLYLKGCFRLNPPAPNIK